jgi:aminomethyltransferase
MTSSDPTTASPAPLLRTPLHALHLELGAKMVPSPATRCRCASQGISPSTGSAASRPCSSTSRHGPLRLTGDDAAAARDLVPVDIVGLAPGKQLRPFTNEPAASSTT